MSRNKKKQFAENKVNPIFFEPFYEELLEGFPLKGKWRQDFFKNDNPIVLELGCGKGEYTVGLAEKYPDKNFYWNRFERCSNVERSNRCARYGFDQRSFHS